MQPKLRISGFLAIGFVLIWVGQQVACSAEDDDRAQAFFRDVIQPIFEAKCGSCHGPKQQKSSYRLDVREIALGGGDSGEPAIVPGKSARSPLLKYVADENSELVMPPRDSQRPRLTQAEIASVRDWIDRGAVWPDSSSASADDPLNWWSFQPLRRPSIPKLESNPIDAFIKLKLAEKNLTFSRPAEARTLGRRVYFDLIGLPPAPEDLDEFERDSIVNADAAVERLVEKLLASPRYGERWARHWLDLVHYGDTHGYDKDKPRPNAWPYRDYVIRAFNADKPYAQFVAEQIAGDVLSSGARDGVEALGFIAAGPWDFIGHAEVPETKIDGKIARHLDRDDMISNTIGTFCSVTVHCAQCHQHKFDPITQLDYYSLQAVFSALDRTDVKYFRDEEMYRQYMKLKLIRDELAASMKKIDQPLRELAGEKFVALSKRIEQASKGGERQANRSSEFGYHSAIASTQSEVKWVQVDLGESTEIDRVTLQPCFDDFNSIGAGFGFPIRFKIEASDDPEFKKEVKLFWRRHDQTFMVDFSNPGLRAFTTNGVKDNGIAGRYVRVTASKLAPRKDDFIFALAELQVFDSADKNVALGRPVVALDSIESAPRWRKSNLTDGIHPAVASAEDKAALEQEREALLESLADDLTQAKRRALREQAARNAAELSRLPPPDLVYAASVHDGSGNFKGTGADGGKPRPIFVLARGQVTQPGPEVFPGALSALTFSPARFSLADASSEGHRRVALARWISDPANPLTWRSIVNRVWQYHFGRGLVDTPNDFGRNGGLPSHPELLDWLAMEFRDGGGSLKRLHKRIVMSATYRQASSGNPEGERIDSSNTLLWRQNRRRLEAEAVRDSVLAVSGELDMKMGGPGWQDFVIEHPEHSPHYEYGLSDPHDPNSWRRSVYRFIVRSQTHPWMTSLDCADPSMRVDKRNESNSAIQALALLNNGFMLAQAKYFAERVERESRDLEAQVERAYRLALGTTPAPNERARLVEFSRMNGLMYLCRLLYNLNAFTFID